MFIFKMRLKFYEQSYGRVSGSYSSGGVEELRTASATQLLL